uniref:Uncharacterized protein n=1 Tax=Siphoviridae sp. ctZgu8 TaxID=2827893 RepID=A0A8S5SL68_9CAUD|nr:MAG TPA: hypothetical protein [Siphoviridae sp. ctZgu8]
MSVPFIDGLRQPAARAPYRGVGLRELEVEQAATGDAKAFCDLFDAEIFSRHCLPFLPDNPARPSTFRTHLPVRSGMRWPARG